VAIANGWVHNMLCLQKQSSINLEEKQVLAFLELTLARTKQVKIQLLTIWYCFFFFVVFNMYRIILISIGHIVYI
jgi:hypothetical protein